MAKPLKSKKPSKKVALDDSETTHKCDKCGLPLDEEKGDVFLTDEGDTLCNDHYSYYLADQEQEDEEDWDDDDNGDTDIDEDDED